MANKIYKIRSFEDLLKIMNYNIESLDKAVKRNRGAKALGILATVYATYAVVECVKQRNELYKLSVRIKKLEHKDEEGE